MPLVPSVCNSLIYNLKLQPLSANYYHWKDQIKMAELAEKKAAAFFSFSWERNQRWFLFSGITGELEKSLTQKIQSLDGKVVCPVSDTFSPQCTHVVAQEFATTEKILGALAGGKWLLTINYILESFKEGHWLKEEQYEFTDLKKVAAYHRQKRKLKGVGLYAGWKVLVLTESSAYSRKFKRILVAGGAEVALKDDTSSIDFVITKEEMLEHARERVDSFKPLVDVSYIRDTLLFKTNPDDLMKYDLRHPEEFKATSEPAHCASESHSLEGGPALSGISVASKKDYSSKDCQVLSQRPAGEAYPNKRRKVPSRSKKTLQTQSSEPVAQEPQNITPTPILARLMNLKECHVNLERITINGICRAFESPNCKTTSNQLKKFKSSRIQSPKYKAISSGECESKVVIPNHHIRRQSPAHKTVSEQVVRNLATPENEGRSEKIDKTPSEQPQPFSVGQSVEFDTALGQHQQEAVTSKQPVYTVTKVHVMEAIVHFLRKYLHGVCSTSTLSLPRGYEKFPDVGSESSRGKTNPEQIIDTPVCCVAHELREMTTAELNFFICCVDSLQQEQEILSLGIESLLLSVSSYLYPPPDILGSLLKHFVLETELSIVHSNALRVAYEVLKLHPPATAKMRAYYILVLQNAVKPDDFGRYIAWKFIWIVIQRASSAENEGESLASQNTALDDASKAIRLLEFIVLLLTEDVRHSSYGEAIQDLLTWHIFWDCSKNCSVTPPPVQQLLRLWMSKRTTTPALKWHLAQLVSVLLEMMWKLSGHLIPINILPHSLAGLRKEIGISLKGLSSQECLEVIRSLHTPWAQAVVTFIIAQETARCPEKISLSCIMDLFNSSSKHTNGSTSPQSESVKVCGSLSSPVKDQSSETPRKSSIPHINKRNSKGETALLRACINNDVEQVMHLLLEPSVDINLCDHAGWTPLHEAALRGHNQCIDLLLSHNPNKGGDLLKDKTRDGKTAFDLASNQEMVNSLKLYRKKCVDDTTTKVYSILDYQKGDEEFFLTLANSYLEVSGNRYLTSSIKKCMRKILKANKSEQLDEQVDDSSLRHTQSKCQAIHEQRINEITKKCMPQYLNLVENKSSQSLSKFEEIAVTELYKWIKMDKESTKTSHHIMPPQLEV